MVNLTGHYKQAAKFTYSPSGAYDESGNAVLDAWSAADGKIALEVLFTVKGAGKLARGFATYATRLGAEFCDVDADGHPRPCAVNTEWPKDGGRPVENAVYRVKSLPSVLATVAGHSAVVGEPERVFVGPGLPRGGSGQATGNVEAAIKRAIAGRDKRDRAIAFAGANRADTGERQAREVATEMAKPATVLRQREREMVVYTRHLLHLMGR
jgi:hypothetical protein